MRSDPLNHLPTLELLALADELRVPVDQLRSDGVPLDLVEPVASSNSEPVGAPARERRRHGLGAAVLTCFFGLRWPVAWLIARR